MKGWILVVGQVDPSSIVGDSLVWKNAQKNDTKNRTSEMMNKTFLIVILLLLFLCAILGKFLLGSRLVIIELWLVQ